MACEVFKVGTYSFAKQWLDRELVNWKKYWIPGIK